MSSKQEIKDLYVNQLKNIPEYQIILSIKQFILNEITIPNINLSVIIYNFDTPITKYQQNIISICFKLEFGFDLEYNINENFIKIEMYNFLN